MRGALLTRKPDVPKTKRVRFDAPAQLVDDTQAMIATAKRHGFELALNDALVDAYARIAAKLRAEIEAAIASCGDDTDTSSATDDAGTGPAVQPSIAGG